ncbi:MAG: hypothetical protein WD342_09080, partial [Verrucomicrobiales bacterium]
NSRRSRRLVFMESILSRLRNDWEPRTLLGNCFFNSAAFTLRSCPAVRLFAFGYLRLRSGSLRSAVTAHRAELGGRNSNFDNRVKAKCSIPADLLRYLRQLEQRVRRDRVARRAAAGSE